MGAGVSTAVLTQSPIDCVDRLRVGRGTARAEDFQGTPTQSHVSPSALVHEDKTRRGECWAHPRECWAQSIYSTSHNRNGGRGSDSGADTAHRLRQHAPADPNSHAGPSLDHASGVGLSFFSGVGFRG